MTTSQGRRQKQPQRVSMLTYGMVFGPALGMLVALLVAGGAGLSLGLVVGGGLGVVVGAVLDTQYERRHR